MPFELLLALVFVSIGGATGIVLCLYLVASACKGVKSRSWPTVAAVVTRSKVRQSKGLHWAEIEFAYQIGEVCYESNLPYFGFFPTQLAWGKYATREVARFPVGTQLRVSYNPRRPQEAALHAGVHWPAVAMGAICCGPWACIGVGLFVNLLRRFL